MHGRDLSIFSQLQFCVGMCGQAGAMGAFENENEVAMTSARRTWACDLLCSLTGMEGSNKDM